MSKRVAMGGRERPEVVEVDLWGVEYTLQPSTRSVVKAAGPLEEKLEDLSDPDEIVQVLAEMIDLRLKAVNGGGKASTHIKRKWKADEMALDDLTAFAVDLTEAERPT